MCLIKQRYTQSFDFLPSAHWHCMADLQNVCKKVAEDHIEFLNQAFFAWVWRNHGVRNDVIRTRHYCAAWRKCRGEKNQSCISIPAVPIAALPCKRVSRKKEAGPFFCVMTLTGGCRGGAPTENKSTCVVQVGFILPRNVRLPPRACGRRLAVT